MRFRIVYIPAAGIIMEQQIEEGHLGMLITFMSLICLAKLTHSLARRVRAPKCFRQKLKLML